MTKTRWGLAMVLCAVLASAPAAAVDFGLGLRAGTQGLGAELGVGLSPWFGLRAGAYGYDLDREYESEDLTYDGTIEMGGYGLIADFYPMKGSFHLSVGYFSNDTAFAIETTPEAPVDIGNGTYDPSQIGTLSGDVTFDDKAPYFGLGWGNVAKGKRVGFLVDLGIVKQGAGDVTMTSSAGGVSQADLDAEIAEIEDDIADYDYWPVLSFGLAIRF